MAVRLAVLTISDLGAAGERADTSGDLIVAWAGEHGFDIAAREIVPDESDRIASYLCRWADEATADVILTRGMPGIRVRHSRAAWRAVAARPSSSTSREARLE